jgi:cell division protein FtsW
MAPSHDRGTIDYGLIGIVSAMILFGLIVLLSASSPNAYKQFGDSYYFLKHQLIFGLIPGIAGLIIFSRIPYTFWKKHAWNLLLVSIGLLVLVFIPGFSGGFGTAHSWVSVGGLFSVQPSEIVKLTFLFYLAGWLGARDERGVQDVQTGLIPFLAVLGIIALLMILQPDTGSMTILASMALIVYFVAGAPVKYIVGLIATGLAGIWFLITVSPYRAARFTTFLHPELDPQGIGYHINQAMLALGSGGFFGFGYGHSRQKFQYLPEVAGDSIFAVIGEEMGFFGATLVVAMFLVLLWKLFEIAKRAPDKFSKYVVIGIGSWIVVQAFENIASMVALMPITGVPLPFISYGGTSLAILMCAIGVVLNISKHLK